MKKLILLLTLLCGCAGLVAAKVANMRQGERTDLEPVANLHKVSQTEAAEMFNVSPRADNPFEWRPGQEPDARLVARAKRLAALTPLVQTSLTGRNFNVTAYGARPDDSTDDWTAFQAAHTAANASGGTVLVPDGIFNLDAGAVGVDARWLTTGGTVHRMLLVADNTSVRLSPKTEIKVKAASVCQINGGSLPPCTQILYGSNETVVDNWRIIGNGGKFTFDRANSAALVAVLNGANGFQFTSLTAQYPYWDDFELRDWPQGGLVQGVDDGTGNLRTYGLYNNIRVFNYGASGHDNNFYWHGNNTFNDWIVINTRAFHSHSWYFGSGRGENVINRAWVKWTGADPTLLNKFWVQHYSETGTLDLNDITIQDSYFSTDGAVNGMLFQHLNTASLKSLRIRLINNDFIGGGSTGNAISIQNPQDCEFRGNRFSGWATAITATVHSSGGTGRNFTVVGNQITSCQTGISVAAGITDSKINNNFVTSPTGSATCLNSRGARNEVSFNKIYNCGSSGGIGMYLAGDGFTAHHNEIFTDNSTGFTEIINVLSGAGWTFGPGNTINSNVSSYLIFNGSDFKITGNTTNQRMIVAATATGSNLYSNNIHNGTLGKPNIRAATNVFGNVCPNGPFADSGSEAAGWLNGTGNTFTSGGLVDTVAASLSAGTTTPHAGVYNHFVYTLTDNVTIGAPTNPTTGRTITFTIIQDGTGGRTITWNAAFKVPCSFNTTASTKTSVEFKYDGTNWVQKGACTTNM